MSVVLFTKLAEVKGESIGLVVKFVGAAVEAADDLSWGVVVEVDFEVLVEGVGVDGGIVEGDDSLSGGFNVDEFDGKVQGIFILFVAS